MERELEKEDKEQDNWDYASVETQPDRDTVPCLSADCPGQCVDTVHNWFIFIVWERNKKKRKHSYTVYFNSSKCLLCIYIYIYFVTLFIHLQYTSVCMHYIQYKCYLFLHNYPKRVFIYFWRCNVSHHHVPRWTPSEELPLCTTRKGENNFPCCMLSNII